MGLVTVDERMPPYCKRQDAASTLAPASHRIYSGGITLTTLRSPLRIRLPSGAYDAALAGRLTGCHVCARVNPTPAASSCRLAGASGALEDRCAGRYKSSSLFHRFKTPTPARTLHPWSHHGRTDDSPGF